MIDALEAQEILRRPVWRPGISLVPNRAVAQQNSDATARGVSNGEILLPIPICGVALLSNRLLVKRDPLRSTPLRGRQQYDAHAAHVG